MVTIMHRPVVLAVPYVMAWSSGLQQPTRWAGRCCDAWLRVLIAIAYRAVSSGAEHGVGQGSNVTRALSVIHLYYNYHSKALKGLQDKYHDNGRRPQRTAEDAGAARRPPGSRSGT